MAVFTDRIILKSSADTEADIFTQIQQGGSDEIVPGEVVVGLTPGTARLYTLDSNNDVVTLGGTAATQLSGLSDVDVTTNPPGPFQSLAYDASTGFWVPSTPVVGASQLNELTDVDLSTNGALNNEDLLEYNSVAGQWRHVSEIGSVGMHRDVDLSVAPTEGQSLVWDDTTNKWKPGVPNIIGLAAVVDDPTPALGGNLDVNGNAIYSAGGIVEIQIDGTNSPTLALASIRTDVTPRIDFFSGTDRFFGLRPSLSQAYEDRWTFSFPPNNGDPTQVLATNGSGDSYWTDGRLQAESAPKLGADLDVNGFTILNDTYNEDVKLAAVTGEVSIRGIYDPRFNENDPNRPALLRGRLSLYDATQNNRVSIASPVTLASAWTMTLPDGPGTNGYALVSDGQGNTRWSAGVAADITSSSITDLVDVDTQTDYPNINEGLIWDGTNWVPGLAQADISAASLGELGDVNADNPPEGGVIVYEGSVWNARTIGIQDADDYNLEETSALTWRYVAGDAGIGGQWETDGEGAFSVANQDANGNNFQLYMFGFTGSFPATLAVSATGEVDSWTTLGLVSVVNMGDRYNFSVTPNNPLAAGTLYLTLEAAPISLPLEDGKVLTWSAAQNKFVPAVNDSGTLDYNELNNKPDIPVTIDDLTDVNTSGTPPTTGQVLEWSGTHWEPGDGQAASVELVQGQTGRVWLKIEDMIDFGDEGAPGREFEFNKNIGEPNADYTQEGVWGPANGGNDLLVASTASGGIDMAEVVSVLPASGNMWIYSSATAFWAGPAVYTSITANYLETGAYNFAGVGAYFSSAANADLKISFVNPNSVAQPRDNGDVLTWDSQNNRFEPKPLDAAGDITAINGGSFGSG